MCRYSSSSSSRTRAAAAAARVAALLAAFPIAAGCAEQAVLLTVDGDLAVPAEARSLTLVVSAREGASFIQQVLGPFDLTADLPQAPFPYEIGLLAGDTINGEVIVSAFAEDADGHLAASGSVVARFLPRRVVRAAITLSRVACADDVHEVRDDPPDGAALNADIDGHQPDLRLCADDLELEDRFNVLLPAGLGLQIVLHGSTPPATLEAALNCPGVTRAIRPMAPNEVLSMTPDPSTFRTCELVISYVADKMGLPRPPVDASYGFSLSTYGGGPCMDDTFMDPYLLSAEEGAADSPSMTLCPAALDTFDVKVGLDRLVAVDSTFDSGIPIMGSVLCPGGAGSTGFLPLYGRTGNLRAGAKSEVSLCRLTLFGASAAVQYILQARTTGLDDCVPDLAEDNDTEAEALDIVAAGWMTAQAGGASPPLTACAHDASGDDDDWFSFGLATPAASMQIDFEHDATLDGGDVDLEVVLPGPERTSLLAPGSIDTIPIATPPLGEYHLRFICPDDGLGCGNVYRFGITLH